MTKTENTRNAVINWVYFMSNYPYDFIEKAFADEGRLMVEHLRLKFNHTEGVDNFFRELDNSHQEKLADWVNHNFHAFSYRNVEL